MTAALLRKLAICHLELVLNVLFIPAITLVHLFLSPYFANPWRFTAYAAVVVGVFHGCLCYGVRRKQRALRHAYIAQAKHLIEDEAKVDARLLLDRLSARPNERLWEIESARRIVGVVDYVSHTHSFVLSDPFTARPSVPAPIGSAQARAPQCG